MQPRRFGVIVCLGRWEVGGGGRRCVRKAQVFAGAAPETRFPVTCMGLDTIKRQSCIDFCFRSHKSRSKGWGKGGERQSSIHLDDLVGSCLIVGVSCGTGREV